MTGKYFYWALQDFLPSPVQDDLSTEIKRSFKSMSLNVLTAVRQCK